LADLLLGRLRAFYSADIFREELQRDIDEVAIEAAATKADRQRDGRHFAHGTGREGRRGTHDALGKRCSVANGTAFAQASEFVANAHGVNRITPATARAVTHLRFGRRIGNFTARFNNPKEVIPCLVRFLGFRCGVSVPAKGEALSNAYLFWVQRPRLTEGRASGPLCFQRVSRMSRTAPSTSR